MEYELKEYELKDFAQPDLKVKYIKLHKKNAFPIEINDVLFRLVIFLNGRNEIHFKDKIYIAKKNDILIARYDEKFDLQHNSNDCEYVYILFGMNTFKDADDMNNLLKPFEQNKQIKIYNNLLDKEAINNALTALIKALDYHSNRPFIYAAVLQILCEIKYAYTKMNPTEIKDTDNKFTMIEDYVEKHIFEKLTLEDVAKATFLSKRCIQYTIEKIRYTSFRSYINKLKLDKSIKLLKDKRVSLNDVSQLLGFETYSTFYRVFKREYGITPKQYRKQN